MLNKIGVLYTRGGRTGFLSHYFSIEPNKVESNAHDLCILLWYKKKS